MSALRLLALVIAAVVIVHPVRGAEPAPQLTDEEWLEEEQERAKGDSASSLLKRVVPQVTFDRVAFGDAVDFMRDVTGATIHLDRAALSAAKVDLPSAIVTLRSDPGKSLEQILKALAAQLGPEGNRGTVAACGGIIVITTEKGLRPCITRHRETLALAKTPAGTDLAKPVEEATLRDVPLSDAVDFLRDVTGTKIFVDWSTLKAAGVMPTAPVNIVARKLILGQVLQLIADDCSAKSTVRVGMKNGVIHVDALPPPPNGAAVPEKPKPADPDGL